MPLANGGTAHVNVNWTSPTKIRQMMIGGSHRTLAWDDLNPQQRVAIHDRGIDLATAFDRGPGAEIVGEHDRRAEKVVLYRHALEQQHTILDRNAVGDADTASTYAWS